MAKLGPGVVEIVDDLPTGAGPIGLLSSDEFTQDVTAFDRALLEASGPRIALLLCANPDEAQEQARKAVEHYGKLGGEPFVLDVFEREEAGTRDVPDFDVVFIGGGSPATLLECIRTTPLADELLARWGDGVAIAGSSAGAMALCRHCLIPTPGDDAPTVWTDGVGPLSRFGLAVHAASRPGEWLRDVARSAPVPVVAMDDATGMLLRPGEEPAALGEGSIRIVDTDRG